MKTCYIMIGVSGSGKSTVMRRLMKIHQADGQSVGEFSLDACRLDFFDQITDDPKRAYADAFKHANENQKQFDEYVNKTWALALKSDVVFVDNTNLTKKARARWIQEARSKGFKIVAVNVMAPLATVLQRQSTRSDKNVPADVVRDMYFRLQEPQADEVDEIVNVKGF